MDMEWLAQVESLENRYKQGDLSALVEAENFAQETEDVFKSIAYLWVAKFALLHGDLAKAEVAIDFAFNYYSAHSEYIDDDLLVLGRISLLFYQGQLQRCLEILEQKQFQDKFLFQYWNAQCLFWKGEFLKAHNIYKTARKNNANKISSEQKCLSYLGQAKCCIELEDTDAGKVLLNTIMQQSPVDEGFSEVYLLAVVEVVKMYAVQEKYIQAYMLFQQHLEPSRITHPYLHSQAICTCGILHFYSHKYSAAKQDFLQIIHSTNIQKMDKLLALYYLAAIEEHFQERTAMDRWIAEIQQFHETYIAQKVKKKWLSPQQASSPLFTQNIHTSSITYNWESIPLEFFWQGMYGIEHKKRN